MNEQEEIDQLQDKGHSYHCACRQVWGDGECECDLYKQGYDPYAWQKTNNPIHSDQAKLCRFCSFPVWDNSVDVC